MGQDEARRGKRRNERRSLQTRRQAESGREREGCGSVGAWEGNKARESSLVQVCVPVPVWWGLTGLDWTRLGWRVSRPPTPDEMPGQRPTVNGQRSTANIGWTLSARAPAWSLQVRLVLGWLQSGAIGAGAAPVVCSPRENGRRLKHMYSVLRINLTEHRVPRAHMDAPWHTMGPLNH